jgi:sugar/nucleoside kinase (ribokinase family)
MKLTIAAGLEATTDVWVTFPSLSEFASFSREYGGALAKHLKQGYATVASGNGNEVAIDGKTKEARELSRLAEKFGATVTRALGGNGSQEAAALKALGSNVTFVGGFSPNQVARLPSGSRKFFDEVDLSFARTSEEYIPISVILQALGTNRYILCEGRGRRIDQLRPYLRDLPRTLEQIVDKYGGLDMVNLVGWHVLFANGISDSDVHLVKNVVQKIRSATGSPLFTDAGGLEAFNEDEMRRLCQIYSLFDIFSVNEDEIVGISQTVGSKAEDEFQKMHDILESWDRPTTIWLHTADHQASLSTKYGAHLLKRAQISSAAAGAYRVEKGTYPSSGEIAERARVEDYSEDGMRAAKKAKLEYNGKIGGANLAVTPCYRVRSFSSTVGAGDVAAAAYTYTIASKGKTS